MNTETQEEVHGGVILISGLMLHQHLLPDTLHIEDTDTQGMLRDKGVFAALHDKLMLPSSFTIQGVYYQALHRIWQVVIACSEMPAVEEGQDFPIIDLQYIMQEEPIENEQAQDSISMIKRTVYLSEIRVDGKTFATYPVPSKVKHVLFVPAHFEEVHEEA